jgi:hypothetical protein
MDSHTTARPRPLVGGGFRLGIFDTSVLTSDIIAALKRGRPSSLQAAMQYGTMRGFVPHYVWAEVPRVLDDRKREGETFDLAAAEALWWQEYVPLLHVVCVSGLPMTPEADKISQEDLSDVGAAQLAGLIAPAVVFASDPDLVRNGVAAKKWGDTRALLGKIGGAESGMWAHTAVTMATGRGLAGAARLARAHPLAAGVMTAAAGIYAYRHRDRLADPELRKILRKTGIELTKAVGDPFLRHDLHQQVWTRTEHGAAGSELLSQVARLLARSPEPLTRTTILDDLPKPPDEPRRRQMDGLGRLLHRFPAFHQAEPGRWQLGRTDMQITAPPWE